MDVLPMNVILVILHRLLSLLALCSSNRYICLFYVYRRIG
jgi:hypothetical protein